MRAALRTRDGEMLWSLRLLLRRGVARSPPRLFVAVERPVSGTTSSAMSWPATANMAANFMRRMFDDSRRWAAKTGSMMEALVGCHGLMIKEGGSGSPRCFGDGVCNHKNVKCRAKKHPETVTKQAFPALSRLKNLTVS